MGPVCTPGQQLKFRWWYKYHWLKNAVLRGKLNQVQACPRDLFHEPPLDTETTGIKNFISMAATLLLMVVAGLTLINVLA